MYVQTVELANGERMEPDELISRILPENTDPDARSALSVLLTHVKELGEENIHLNKKLRVSERKLAHKRKKFKVACQLLDHQSRSLTIDLERAARIQHALLPHEPPHVPGMSIAALYHPSKSVGGDFYDLQQIDSHRFAFAIADAAGHGVSAALLAVLFRVHLHQSFQNDPARSPKALLSEINTTVGNECASLGIFVSAACGIVDTQEGTLQIASAGHPPLLLQKKSGKVAMLQPTGPALGLATDASYDECTLQFKSGDRLFCYTDGLTDDWPDALEQPAEILESFLRETSRKPQDVVAHLYQEACLRRNAKHSNDDVTLLCISARTGPSTLENADPGSGSSVCSEENPDLESGLSQASITVGTNTHGTTFQVAGRGDWTDSPPLFKRATTEIREGHALTIELSQCTHLDSTFLGTLHEVIAQADERGIAIKLQGMQPQLRKEFDELGMKRVLSHVQTQADPGDLPVEMTPLEPVAKPDDLSRERLLKAHEALASLSDKNRAEFEQLLLALHRETDKSKAS